MSRPSKRTDPAGRLEQPQQAARRASTCRSPTRRRGRASRPARSRASRRRPRARDATWRSNRTPSLIGKCCSRCSAATSGSAGSLTGRLRSPGASPIWPSTSPPRALGLEVEPAAVEVRRLRARRQRRQLAAGVERVRAAGPEGAARRPVGSATAARRRSTAGARRSVGPGAGSSRAAPTCRGAGGRRRSRRARPARPPSPPYMTSTRSAISATTPRSWVIRITEPSSPRSSSSSSMICAWIVTSSAVVGSSAIRIRGRFGERHRDHRALAHAARELVRVAVHPLGRVGDARPRPSSSIARSRAAACRDVLVRADLLGDLPADPVHGVQRRHRVLEDHRDLLAADRAQRLLRRAQQLGLAP